MAIGGTGRRTVQNALDAASGRPSGFDYLRLGLSLAVFATHSVGTSYGEAGAALVWQQPFAALPRAILPMFFALSGFLVAGSMERCATLVKFLGLRVIRIYPALAVEVLLSALVIGPLLTTVSLASYFSDPILWRYLVNVTGFISYHLPGLFADNPVPSIVNRQLWTVPFELDCYIALGALIVCGAKQRRIVVPVATLLLLAWYVAPMLYRRGVLYESGNALTGQLLVVTFLVGVSLFLYREYIPFSGRLCLAMAVVGLASLSGVPGGTYFAILPLAYVTVYLGMLDPRRIGLIRSADYSYGIFLYGFVVQQTVMAVLPWAHHWYWNIAIALPLTVAVAAASWHFVEKPAAKLKHPVAALERWWLRTRARLVSRTGYFAGTPLEEPR